MIDARRAEVVGRIGAALGPEAQLHLVGGALRDLLLGRSGGDWDLATALDPREVMARAKAAHLRSLPTGLQHGTVTILVEGEPYEVTSFRGDGPYLDGRRPIEVRLGVSLEEDLARRDFTINALALPVEALAERAWRTALVDPFGGQADLVLGLIRAVGDPQVRFAEDGLRPLRACRFAAQLGFRVEDATEAAIPRRLEVARRVAVERVFVELGKLLVARAPSEGLELLARTGLLDLWLPELRPLVDCPQGLPHRWDVWRHTLALMAHLRPEPALRWAALFHDAGKPRKRTVDDGGRIRFLGHEAVSLEIAQTVLVRLKAPKALQGQVQALVRHHGTHPELSWSDGACRRFLARLADDGLALADWSAFRRADQLARGGDPGPVEAEHTAILTRLEGLAAQRPPLAAAHLALDGRALMALAGRSGGPWLGALQRHLLDQVLEDPRRNEPAWLEGEARVWLAGAPE